MKIQFTLPLGSDGWDKHLDMPAAPRVGDQVAFDMEDDVVEYSIKHVVWYPNSPEIDVYVVLRP
jgi:hypothetical protein